MRASTSSLVAFAMLAVMPTTFAKYNQLHMLLTSINASPLPVQTVELPIDHFGGASGTFKNRWWYNDTFYQPGGPVIIEDGGEGDAEPVSADLQEDPGTKTALMQLAQKYKGLAIVWEHRYYGKSVPFVQNKTVKSVQDMNAHQWSFLSLDQALEDVVTFANNFKLPSDAPAASRVKAPDALHASKTPWIFMGGSYPGVRAATLRQRNPETIFASWASSAPVQAQISMASYYDAVERGLPQNCSTDLATAIKFFDDSVKGGNTTLIQLLKNDVIQAVSGSSQRVSFSDSDEYTPVDIAGWLVSSLPDFQNQGPSGMLPFCNFFETDGRRFDATDGGLSPDFSPESVWLDLMDTITAVTDRQTASQVPRKSPVSKLGSQGSKRLPAPDQDTLDGISWNWQWCSEFGFFQTGDPNAKDNIVSTLIDVPEVQDECNKQFPGMLPPAPKVDNVNKYGGWNTNVTRVFFSNGEFDPWRTLSVASVESNAPQRKAFTNVPAFDAKPDSSAYYGAVYNGQVHVSDFFFSTQLPKDTQAAFNNGMSMMTAALDAWLPHFTPGNDPIPTATGSDSKAASTDAAGNKNGASRSLSMKWSVYGIVTGLVLCAL